MEDDNNPLSNVNHLDIEESQPNLNTKESPSDFDTDESLFDLNTKESSPDLNANPLPDLNHKELSPDLNANSLPDLNTKESSPNLNANSLPDLNTKQSLPNLEAKESMPDYNTEESPPDFNTEDIPPDTEESPPDDHHVISNNLPAKTFDLTSIKLTPKIRKRGRPKGAGLTVIGLPRKKKCTDGPVKFLKKTNSEKEKQILSWMLPDHLVEKVLQNEILECEQLKGNLLEFSPNLLDENVNWASVQKYFTRAAWIQITNKMQKLRRDPKWKCGTCHEDLSLSPSVVCKSCLTWYHLKCVGLTAAPKKTLWFCPLCNGTDDAVKKKENAEIKVNLYQLKIHSYS